jgi:MFS family permease
VLFSWLVTIVLHEDPRMVGVAQMAVLVPAALLMLVGGSLSDHFGGKRIAVSAQLFALTPMLLLAALLGGGGLRFAWMLVYAVAVGVAQAFVTPARDSLLNEVADTWSIQRTVIFASFVQFGAQIAGFLIASRADAIGPLPIIAVQGVALAVGAVALSRVGVNHVRDHDLHWLRDMFGSVAEGARTVLAGREMRLVVLQNMAMGMCFMGSYIVGIPLLIREVYHGSSADLGFVNAANSAGLVSTVLALMAKGDVRNRRRALLLAQVVGSCVLALIGVGFGFRITLALIYLWGACGGLAMSMARTIMQEDAPAGQTGRVMSFFSFSLLGAGPIGALCCGYLVTFFGPERALMIAAAAMGSIVCTVGLSSRGELTRAARAEP